MSMHYSTSQMGDHKIEHLWSERFQDLASWCLQPQDEFNTPSTINHSNEINVDFDDQSMYYSWEANSSLEDQKSEYMWKPQVEIPAMITNPFTIEEANNNLLLNPQIDKRSQDNDIKYSANLYMRKFPFVESELDPNNIMTNIQSTSLEPEVQQTPPQQILNKSGLLSSNEGQINTLRMTPTKEIPTNINKPKPSLKLNINSDKEESSTLVDTTSFTLLNTPDVLKHLLDGPDFNILSYVYESSDDQNLTAVNPASIVSQRPVEIQSVSEDMIKSDHDYAEEPISTFHNPVENQPLSYIKEEDDNNFCQGIALKEEPASPGPSSFNLDKRKRKSTNKSDDFIFDDNQNSDESDWTPSVKKKCKVAKKKLTTGKQTFKRTRTSSFSDSGSVTSGPDRYRELRDRNNEASRRSRLNRKQREVELMEQHTSLQQQNITLTAKAAALEKRVKSLRQILLKLVLDKK